MMCLGWWAWLVGGLFSAVRRGEEREMGKDPGEWEPHKFRVLRMLLCAGENW